MAKGRTVGSKYIRAYVDGYDLSGYTRTVGQLGFSFDQNEIITLTDAVKGAYPGQCTISVGDINAVLDNTTGGLGMHEIFKSSSDAVRDVMIPIGIRAAPAASDPVFCAQVSQNAYQMNDPGEGVVTVTMDLGSQDVRRDASTGDYWLPWGNMIHAKGAETAVNASTGELVGTAQTLFGGYMMYQVFPGSTGKLTIKVQDSTGGGAWSDLASSGILTQVATTGQAAIIALGSTGTVDHHLRWQIAFGGAPAATTTTFALAFVRGRPNT